MNDEQSEGMEALNQSLNDHMEICDLKRKVKRLEAKVKRLNNALAFSNSLAKGLYEMVDYRMSKKDLMGIGFAKEQADAEWEAYRAAEKAAKEVRS